MADMYAWTPLSAGDNSAKVGDKVSASSLGIDQEEFDHLVEVGSIRAEKYPEMPEGVMDSPVNVKLAAIQKELAGMGTSVEGVEDKPATSSSAGKDK